MTEIINKVASSGLISLDLEDYYHQGERVIYDLKENLFMGLILKEKDFRMFLKEHDWTQYQDKNVAIICSEDAIIPTWAYMLLGIYLQPVAHCIVFGNLQALENKLFDQALGQINPLDFEGKKVVVKGCSKFTVPISAYLDITTKLKPHVQSLMYGEPCSTVPLYKKR
jgi:hypothetical protein